MAAAKKTANASKPSPVVEVKEEIRSKQRVYKCFKTSDEALFFHLTIDPSKKDEEEQEVLDVHDTETGNTINLAIDSGNIDEIIKLLQDARSVILRHRKGENIPSDPEEEFDDDGEEEEEIDEEEEDDEP